MAKKSDPVCDKFLDRVKKNPHQVLRYQIGGKPLWVSAERQMNLADVPPCELCKSPRHFEFQVRARNFFLCSKLKTLSQSSFILLNEKVIRFFFLFEERAIFSLKFEL
jgi:hypothetical protein